LSKFLTVFNGVKMTVYWRFDRSLVS